MYSVITKTKFDRVFGEVFESDYCFGWGNAYPKAQRSKWLGGPANNYLALKGQELRITMSSATSTQSFSSSGKQKLKTMKETRRLMLNVI